MGQHDSWMLGKPFYSFKLDLGGTLYEQLSHHQRLICRIFFHEYLGLSEKRASFLKSTNQKTLESVELDRCTL